MRGAAGDDFSHLLAGYRFPILRHDHHLDVVQGFPDGRQTAQLGFHFVRVAGEHMVVRRQHGDSRGSLGLPKCVDESGVGKLCDGIPDDRQGHRSGAVGDDVQRGQVVLRETWVIHHVFQHGGHQHGAVGPVRDRQIHPFFGIELGHHNQGATAEHRRERRLESRRRDTWGR